MRMLVTVLMVAAVAYGVLFAYLYAFQSRFVYFPTRDLTATPEDNGLNYTDVAFITSDNVNLHGWYVPGDPGRLTVLFLHGNAGNISQRLETLRILHELGTNVLLFDYRGYGRSAGTPSEQGTYLDAQAAWQYLTDQRQLPAADIVVMGRSLGGAVAADLAARHEPGALILESTFRSANAMVRNAFPVFPATLLSRFEYDTESKLVGIRCPVLVIHSPDDEIIPYSHGRALFQAANPPREFLELTGPHNGGHQLSGSRYIQGLDRFLEQYAGQ